jgi:hypothetical protein
MRATCFDLYLDLPQECQYKNRTREDTIRSQLVNGKVRHSVLTTSFRRTRRPLLTSKILSMWYRIVLGSYRQHTNAVLNGKLCGKQSNHRVLKGSKWSRCKQAEFYKRPITKFSTAALESAGGKIRIDYKAGRRFGLGGGGGGIIQHYRKTLFM